MILQAHYYPKGTQSLFQKNVGVGPSWGEFFPNFFRDIDLKICVRYARDPGKTRLKIVTIGLIGAELET